MALAAHLRIAQTEGPKAGFNAYVATLERAGLDTTRNALAELRAQGGKKAQFEFYCGKFGSKFGATPTKVDGIADLQARIDELQAQLAERQVGVTVFEPESKPATRRNVLRRTRKAATTDAKINLWRPWAIRKYGIPAKVGGTFQYKSKRAGKLTTHQVVRITAEGAYCKRVA